MKWRLYLIAICALLFVSCSSRRGRFRMEGHFLHMNQGRLLVYSNDGIINGIDTINISGGRFSYEIPCNELGTLMIVFLIFPNNRYSQSREGALTSAQMFRT